ncbi:universal stress protein [Leptolyngbya sp. AN03gr2]|uniref:universal stress protein n=1 Tax=unclassified Leptolyngbya TaxID=2650499 RepID=UPI003D31FEFC
MNVHSMLVRLQGTLGRTDLVQKMMLIPASGLFQAEGSEINLVVGYSNSPSSQTALDLTLWIAHQTRLATGKQVTVQVVYVVADSVMNRISSFDSGRKPKEKLKAEGEWRTSRTAIAELETSTKAQFGTAELFEQADRILWNARCMAEEWRGSLKTHLRFGTVANELKAVVATEKASLLILGCDSPQHPLIRQLGKSFACPVLGIPSVLEGE